MKTAEQIITAERDAFLKTIYAALEKFTENTGYPLTSVDWEVVQVRNDVGCAVASKYYNVRLNLNISE
jgi:hypothetical protein